MKRKARSAAAYERNRDRRIEQMAARTADITKRIPDQLKERRRKALVRLHRRREKHGEISPEGRD